MTSFAGAALLVVGFVGLCRLFGLIQKSTTVIDVAKLALTDLRNPGLDDDTKEIALQRYAKRLFGLFLVLTLGGAGALFLPLGCIWLLEQLGVLSFDAVIDTTLSWEFLLATTLLALVIFWIVRKRQ
jgi:hypothetical protein